MVGSFKYKVGPPRRTPPLGNGKVMMGGPGIRDIPDHATFRGKGVFTGLVGQTFFCFLFGPM